jgi:hypothetical protein
MAISSTLSTVSFDQFGAACAGADAQGRAYRIGDLYVVVALTNVSYPAAKLPDGVALKPFKLTDPSDGFGGLPRSPEVNPGLDRSGVFVELCNTRTTASHRIEGASVRIDRFTPFTGALNSWQFCDGWYQSGQRTGGGCGGGYRMDAQLNAAFPADAGVGAVAPASLVADNFNETSLPPNQSRILDVTLTAPTAPGTYQFSFSVTLDGAKTPFASLPDALLLGPARTWAGDACAIPAMQSQIPSGSADRYICPTSIT